MTKRIVLVLTAFAAGIGLATWQSAGGAQGSAKVAIVEQGPSGTTFEVTVPGVEVTPTVVEGRSFSEVTLPGEVMAVLEEGKPQVPKVSVLLAIPTGARVTTRVLARETRTLAIGNVLPQQPPLTDDRQSGPLVYDAGFYGRDVSYPGRDLALMHTGVWRDLAVANLQVYPVQVNPGKGTVDVTTRIRVRVDYAGGSYPRAVADWMIPQYAQYVDNFNQLGLEPLDYSPGVRYLVIGHNNYAVNSFLNDSLLGYVKARGYDVRRIFKSSFTAQEVKDSIRAEYNRNNPKTLHFVLLVGEYTEIPMGSYSGVGRSDFWYSDLEPWPSGDNYPEVALARFSPDSAGDLNNQIRKTLKYQRNPPSSSNWLTKIRMPTHKELYPGKYSGCTRGIYFMPKPYYPGVDIDTIMGQFRANSDVTAAINAGVGIVPYRGHGDYQEWWAWDVSSASWYNSHVDALTNGDLTPVVYNIACNCGDIGQSECLSERWMGKYPGGAVANFGATQASYTYPNHGICSTLVRATTDTWTITVPGIRNYGPTVYLLSDVRSYGIDAYVAKYWPSSPYPDNIYMYVAFGDPAMPIWTGGMPATANVTAPDSFPLGPYNVQVTVQVSGQPVEGALVCLWKDPDVYVAERTDASGIATLAVNATSAGDVMLTVSEGHARHSVPGANHTPILPVQRTIHAGGGGGNPQPSVVYVSNQVIDSTGNNNGRFDPGESGKIYVTVRNQGNAPATNLTGLLSSNNGQFTITDPNANYGTLPQDSTRTNRSDPFMATAGAGIPPGTTVTCTLKLHCDNYGDWTYTFQLQVGQSPTPPQFVVDIDTGAVLLSTCAIGSIGWDEPQADLGSGFKVPKSGSNTLFFGGLMAGNSATYLVDHFYGQPANSVTNHDWRAVESLLPVLPADPADERWRGVMTDAGHGTPQGLRCEQNWYMNADAGYDKWAVVTYDFTNSGSGAINGFYAGMIADFDIGSDPAANTVVCDTVNRRIYMRQSSSENPCAGLVLLQPASFGNIGALDHARYVYPDSCVTDGQKYRVLNGGIIQRNSNRPYDWSCFVSAGPRDLGVGATWRAAFAVVGATSASDWNSAAQAAQEWYNANLLGIAEEETPLAASARRPLFLSPNPFRTGTYVHYYTATAGRLEVVAFDATGREAERQTFEVGRGTGRRYWRPRSLSHGVYFVRVQAPDARAVSKVLVLE